MIDPLVMLAPSAALVVLGWRLMEHDRALEQQLLSEQRESAAVRAVMILQLALTATEGHLTNPKRKTRRVLVLLCVVSRWQVNSVHQINDRRRGRYSWVVAS